MMGRGLLLVALLLASCKQEPQRQQKMSDAKIAEIHRTVPGMTDECLDKIKWGGWAAAGNETDKCFKMLPASRWRGLLLTGFEGHAFCPSPAKQCGTDAHHIGMGLEFKSQPPGINADTPTGGLYEVDFIGRRTAHGQIFGDRPDAQVVVVDRWIAIKEIEAPPKE